jgi:hypothetical protein
VSGHIRVPDVIKIWVQIVDPWEVHIFMQQDALSAVNFVECKIFCVLVADDVFQVRELIVVEKHRAERYTLGLRENVFVLNVGDISMLRDVSDSLCLCRFILAAHLSDGPIACRRSDATYPQTGDPSPLTT